MKRNFYDSQTQAAQALGCTVEEIRRAKRLGHPGFKSGRVYPSGLKEWIRKNPMKADEITAEDWRRRRLRAQVELLESENARERAKVIDPELVKSEWEKNLQTLFQILEAKLDRQTFQTVAKEIRRAI